MSGEMQTKTGSKMAAEHDYGGRIYFLSLIR